MEYGKYIGRAYDIACRHGFHDRDLPLGHWQMLVVTEVSELVEADRKQMRARRGMFEKFNSPEYQQVIKENILNQERKVRCCTFSFCFESFIKDTVEDEMADVCIRLFDIAGTFGFKIDDVRSGTIDENIVKQFRSKLPTEIARELCYLLSSGSFGKVTVEMALLFMETWAKALGIDLEWHIAMKMQYNDERPRMHGKKY